MLRNLALDEQSDINSNFEWQMLLKNKCLDQHRNKQCCFNYDFAPFVLRYKGTEENACLITVFFWLQSIECKGSQ